MKFNLLARSYSCLSLLSQLAYGRNFHLSNNNQNYGSIRGLSTKIDSHCGYEEPPNKKEIDQKVEAKKQKLGKTGLASLKNSNIDIDVYFYVFSDAFDNGEVSNSTIEKQMDILNDAYGGNPSSYNSCGFSYGNIQATPFRFNLQEVHKLTNSLAFDLDSNGSERIRRDLRSGTCGDLYIYTGTSEFLGSSSYPSGCAAENDPTELGNKNDGVVINYGTLPEGHINDYNQGDTLVHEVGHWLGLYHTFEGGCGTGDAVADTAPERSPAFGCPIGRDTCTEGGVDPIHNFMDFTDDCCMYSFTEDQTDRMVLHAEMYRNLQPPSSAPSLSPIGSPTSSPTRSNNFPTSTPTATPTAPECESTDMAYLDMNINVDANAENDNTLFKLAYFSNTNDRFKNFKERSFENNENYTWGACIPKAECYRFTMTDDSKDGICCENGNGFYSIDFNDQSIVESFEDKGKSKVYFGSCDVEKMIFGDDEDEEDTKKHDVSLRK